MVLTVQELEDIKRTAEWLERVEEEKEKRKEFALRELSRIQKSVNPKRLMAVHLTNYFPKLGIIRPFGSSTKLQVDSRMIYFPRETIHFALNGPVGSHLYGNWDGVKYGILIPLDDIFKRVYHLAPEDTFVLGQIRLPQSAEILGKSQDFLGKDGGKAKLVLLNEGENIYYAVQRRIKERGYPLMNVTMHGWAAGIDQEAARLAYEAIGMGNPPQFRELVKSLGKETGGHESSLFGRIEEVALRVYEYLYQCKDNKQLAIKSDNGKTLKILKERCQKVIAELKELIEKRELQNYGSLINSSEQDELSALKRIFYLMNLLSKEIAMLSVRADQTADLSESLEKLEVREKRWLLYEYSLLKKLKDILSTGNKEKVGELLSKLAKAERKVYQIYKQLKLDLEALGKNGFAGDLKDIEHALDYAEGELAAVFSFHSGKLQELIDKGDLEGSKKLLDKMEAIICGLEKTLQTLNETFKARKDYFA